MTDDQESLEGLGDIVPPGTARADARHDTIPSRLGRALARHRDLRLDLALPALGLACIAAGKFHHLRAYLDANLFPETLYALISDITFFCGLYTIILLMHAFMPARTSMRAALLLGVTALLWSVADLAWLVGTGSQIHLSVAIHLVRAPLQFGPIVAHGLLERIGLSIPILLCAVPVTLLVARQLLRPVVIQTSRPRLLVYAGGALLLGCASLAATTLTRPYALSTPRRAALAFNCHVLALNTIAGRIRAPHDPALISVRSIARAGERALVRPADGTPRPHVVMVILESTGHRALFGAETEESYPAMASLAREGIVFDQARACVTHTTPSQFSILTGLLPSLEGGFPEAVLVDRPYESIATILKAGGYRTGFYQMSKATFECNPALVANLGFDSFVSREDFGDSTTHLGYFSGNDMDLVAPALNWLDGSADPALLVLMTSVPHHPYEVPEWFGAPRADAEEAYRQALRFQDRFLGAVTDELERRGLRENSVVCIVGDHGQGFGAHGVLQHNRNPYDEALCVPWVINWPGGDLAPRRIGTPCYLADVTPTLLALLGYDVSRAGFTGIDAMAGPAGRELFFAGWGPAAPAGLVQQRQKRILWPDTGAAYAFDLLHDPEEQNPAPLNTRETGELRARLQAAKNRTHIAFDPTRYRERLLYGRWQTFSLGNTSWCYYAPPGEGQPLPSANLAMAGNPR